MRVAIVGTGGIAGICHVPAIRAHSGRARLVAAADVDESRVKAFCATHDIPAAYTSLTDLLAVERPDLVHICTPPHAHGPQIAECLAAGAWVWCEKPATLTLAEYDAVDRPELAVVSQHRYGSGARHLRSLVADGTLGRPLVAMCVTAWYRPQEYFDVPWRGSWTTEGGGPTMGHGIHQMDLLLSVLGEWTEIRAMAGRLDRDIETEDVSMAVVRFAGGAMATIVNSLLSPREESYLRFDLTDATVELRHLYGYRNADWTSSSPLWNPPDDVPSSHEAQLGALLDAYEKGENPGMSGRPALELITGIYASAFTGRPVMRAELTSGHPYYRRLDGAPWKS
ncbi:Gfo/Idh/MocA family oxidoreductase [Streptosporangiaceae bacterium NEAU-GS5]|nr:Gfo/Idh/MocA family oxidoreductase [Streptosporangiaceae bacterium NEAU-GS5]